MITFEQALYKIASYCSRAERAQLDVLHKLERWKLNATMIQDILVYLKKENYLNEERYCMAFINDKIKFNKWGKKKIYFELKKKNISDNLISESFDKIDNNVFEKPLMDIITLKIDSIKAKNNYEKRNKLIQFALNKGYDYDLIKKCISKFMNNDDMELFS